MKFKVQQYQTDAVESTVTVFNGQKNYEHSTIDFSAKIEAFLNESISSDTVKGYMQALKTLERMMQESNVITDFIFEYTTWEQIKPLKEYLECDVMFIQKNTSAHNKYSAAFNKYTEFISALIVAIKPFAPASFVLRRGKQN